MRRGGATLLCCALLAGAPAAAQAAKHDWPRFGYDTARSNHSKARAGIAARDVKHLRRQDVTLPGTTDSSPIYLHGVEVAGRKRDVFFLTTMYGRAVAVDADKGKVLWTYTPSSYDSLFHTPQYTTSTPVADRKAGYVYSPSPDGFVHKLAIADGAEVRSGGWPASVTRDAKHDKISSSLNLSGGRVIATTGGYGGDIPPYQGHVVLLNASSGAVEHVFNALCGERRYLMDTSSCTSGAGIWARAGAVVVPGTHRLLVVTGNGKWDGATNWGDTVLELSPDVSSVFGAWTPANQSAMASFDVDLGSTAPALVRAGGRLLGFQSGKDGEYHLLDVADLNGRGHPCACLGGELRFRHRSGNVGVFSTPAVWRHRGQGWVFVSTYFDVTAFRITNGKQPKLRQVWRRNRAGSSPVLAGGLLYVYDPNAGGVNVYRPASGKRVGKLASDDGHWNSPIVVDGRVAIPVRGAGQRSATGVLTIYRKP